MSSLFEPEVLKLSLTFSILATYPSYAATNFFFLATHLFYAATLSFFLTTHFSNLATLWILWWFAIMSNTYSVFTWGLLQKRTGLHVVTIVIHSKHFCWWWLGSIFHLVKTTSYSNSGSVWLDHRMPQRPSQSTEQGNEQTQWTLGLRGGPIKKKIANNLHVASKKRRIYECKIQLDNCKSCNTF